MTNPNFTNKKYSFFLFTLFLLSTFFSQAQDSMTSPPIVGGTMFKTLHRDSLLQMTLTTQTKQLVSQKFKEEWQPITLNLADTLGEAIEWAAKVRTRGNIRKKVCFYPPLKIKFKKKWLEENGLDSNYNDLKLVIGCKKGDAYSVLVLKEYLIYKLYEALTDISFRTQLAEIKFIDTDEKWKPINTYAFFIENQDEMAARLNATCTKPKRFRSKHIYADQLDLMALFQYMIGNTDWSAHGSHNVRLIKSKDYPLPLPIAYDFDYAGLVDAPYAIHGEGIDLEEITDRMYLGMCRAPGTIQKHIPLFKEKKETFYNIIQDFPHLGKRDKKVMISYLDEFYKIINHPKILKRNILSVCRENGR